MTPMYVVVRGDDEDEFAKTVASYLADGWQPSGGIAIAYCGEAQRGVFCQALVREKSHD